MFRRVEKLTLWIIGGGMDYRVGKRKVFVLVFVYCQHFHIRLGEGYPLDISFPALPSTSRHRGPRAEDRRPGARGDMTSVPGLKTQRRNPSEKEAAVG